MIYSITDPKTGFFHRSLLVFAAKIGKGFSSFIFAWTLARFFGASDSGLYFLGQTIVLFSSQFAQLGFHQGCLKFIPLANIKNGQSGMRDVVTLMLFLIIISGGLLTLFMYFFSETAGARLFNKPDLIKILKAMAPITLGWALIRITGTSWQAQNDMSGVALYENLFLPFLSILMVIISYVLSWPIQYFALSNTFIYLLISAFMLMETTKRFKADWSLKKFFNFSEVIPASTILKYSVPLMAVGMVQYLILWSDSLMLGYFMASKDVGIYNVAVRIALASTLLLYVVNTTFPPLISAACAKNNWYELTSLYEKSVRYLTSFSIPVFYFLLIYAKDVLSIFGKEFAPGEYALTILLVGQFFNVVTGPAGFILMLSGKERLETINIILTFTLNIILNILLIPRYGLIGAATATSASIIVVNILRVFENIRLAGNPFFRLKIICLFTIFSLSAAISFYLINGHLFSRWLFIPFPLLLLFSAIFFYPELVNFIKSFNSSRELL